MMRKSELRAKLATARQAVQVLNDECKIINANNDTLRAERDAARYELAEASQTVATLEEVLLNTEQDCDQYRKDIAALRRKIPKAATNGQPAKKVAKKR